ncbi:MAG: ABC transporter permease [Planctomycetota bacterium]|nr:ABC transporter permease [Planctomycetota bacterium]
MWRSIRRVWAIALLTSTEGLRQPAFFLMFITAAMLTAFSPSFAFFHLGEEAKMVVDLGLSTVLTFSTLLALLTASSTVTDEIEGRTALTMLSKPLRREEFLAGKYFGVASSACALVLLTAPVLLVTLRGEKYELSQDPWFRLGVVCALAVGMLVFGVLMVLRLFTTRKVSMVMAFWVAYGVAVIVLFAFVGLRSPPAVGWDWRVLIGLLMIGLHACVISAAAVTLATRLTLVQAAIGTAGFFLAGHASGALVAPFRDAQHRLTVMGHVLRVVLPDLDQFNLTDALATAYIDKPVPIPWDVVAGSTLYALLYGAAVLALGAALFSRRELG